MCAKGNPTFSCPTIISSSDDESLGLENNSKEDLFDFSLNTVNVSVNTELPMNSSYGSEEEEFDFLHFYEELSDYDFHRMMSVDDFTYSTAFSNEVFDNGEWYTYAGLETCNIMKSTRHGKELLSKSIQSTTQGDSGIDNLTYLSGDDTKLGTDHTKADVYESSNDMSGGKSISENQNESDSELEDDFFSVPEETEIFSESDDGEYFSADESLEGTLDASFKSILCTVVSYQDNLGLNDLDPSTVGRSSEVPDPSDMWEDVDLSSLCIFNELPLEPCDNEVMFSRPIGFVGSSTDAIDYAKDFLRRQSTLENLLSAKSPDDCDDANSIWSILTDKLLYCQSDTSDSVRHFSYDSLKADSAKQRFFNAALNNEPCLSNSYIDSCNMAELYRDQLYDTVPTPNKKKLNTAEATANSNEPTGKRVFPQYVEDRYQDLEINTSYKYNPETSICATYLWTENIGYPKDLVTATAYHTEGYKLWFKQGRFPIGIDGEATAHLLDDTPIPVKTLIDSGASRPILSRHFYDTHPFLHTYPRYKIPPRGMVIGNDTVLPCDEAIAIMVKFSGHVFHMICYLMEVSKDYGLYIGQKAMYELEGGADFRNLSFHFLMRSLNLYAGDSIKIKPGQTKIVPMCLDTHAIKRDMTLGEKKRLDIDLYSRENEKVMVNLKTERKDKLVQTIPAVISQGTVFLTAVNNTDTEWKIDKYQMMGSLDCRSLGYFHISRHSLQRIMSDNANFLNDRETVEYFNILMEDHKNVMKFAQETILQRQKMEAERNTELKGRQSKGKEDFNDSNMSEDNDPYPWLDKDDPRRNMTDRECLENYIDLSDSDITEREKKNLYKVLYKYKRAFSLRDEIGLCQNMEVELELRDETPFFIRPFPIKESDKDIVDKEMRKGCLLGILKKGMSSYSSPIMLIPRKLSGIPRIVTDFRHLNSRLVTLQPSIPLVKDAIQILGASGCETLSLADLRDAYHTLRLSDRSKKFCGITPYYGSDSYLYQRLGMGLSVSPAIWQNFIQKVLQEIPDHRKNHLAIIDDCLVFSKKYDHLKHLTNLFKALIRNGLKISPRKCKLFKTSLVYMGHQVNIIDGIPHITPVKSRVDAIVKLDPPKSPKNCKQFCGMVNYLSMFLKDLQTKLIPIYHLTKKGVPFYWGELQQEAFDQIKKDLTEAPVLAMPNSEGHMVLVSDTSKIACGSALYQEQKGRYRLIAYFSKKLPLSAQRYSISELELTGIYANVLAFKHLLRNVHFTLYCDHSALVHIMNGKKEPPTLRLKKLIENLSDFKFDIKFLRGKDMFVSDFLSRHPDGEESCNDPIIPVAFLMKEIELPQHSPKFLDWLNTMLDSREMVAYKESPFKECKCERIMNMNEPFQVLTRSMAKTVKADVPAMYPLKGDHKKPEKSQIGIIEVKDAEEVGQDEVQMVPNQQPNIENNIMADIDNVNIPEIVSRSVAQNMPKVNMTGLQVPPVLNEPIPMKPVKRGTPVINYDQILTPVNIDVTRGQLPPFDMEKSFDAIQTSVEQYPDLESLFREDKPLFKPGTEISLFMKHIPKQKELDKFVNYLKQRVIHDCKVPLSVKELKAEYHIDPYFKDIVKYLERDYCRYVGRSQTVFKMQCEDYVLVNGVLFKIRYGKENKGEPSLVLCIPEKYIPTVLYQYHTPLLAGHPGVIKLYETIKQRYYFPGMFNLVREFVECCLECQSMKGKTDSPRIQYARIPLDTRTMERMSMDIKEMPESELGFRHILVCVCEFTNWMKTIPLADQKAQTIAMALYFKICCEYGTPKAIICDEAPAFQSVALQEYFRALNIQPIYISPMNHGSNRSERYIRTLNDIITKCLVGTGSNWPLYVPSATFAMNCQVSQVTGFSPFQMVFNNQPPDRLSFDFDPTKSGMKVDTPLYMIFMDQNKVLINQLIMRRKKYETESQLVRESRKYPDTHGYAVGDLVLINHSPSSVLKAPSRKLKRNWVGPFKIQAIIDDSHYMISDWTGQLSHKRFHVNRLKPFSLNLGKVKDGKLQTVHNTRELFRIWKNIKEDIAIDTSSKHTQT